MRSTTASAPYDDLEELRPTKTKGNIRERKMMAVVYYIQESSNEWESVERWENEGGRLRQNHDLSLDYISEDYLSRMKQAIPIGRLDEPDDIARAMLFFASDETKYITGQTLLESVSAV
jgi:hypothetical protein